MTISEIAKMAGVSPAAVSRYLNNGYLSDDKKEAIRRVIEETGYKPSLQAQILRTKKTRLISVIFHHTVTDTSLAQYMGYLLCGLNSVFSQNGYDLLYHCTEGETDALIHAAANAKTRCADGIVVICDRLSEACVKQIKEVDLPVLTLGAETECFASVVPDYSSSIHHLTEQLILRGACKLAFIGLPPQNKCRGADRFDGYKSALQGRGVPLDTSLIALCESTIANGYTAMQRLLTQCSGIDAVVCGTDVLAAGARKYLSEHPAARPIRTSGFGGTELAEYLSPDLLTASIDLKQLGSLAAETMIQYLTLPEGSRVPIRKTI